MDDAPSLLQLCVQKLAQNLIKYGPKKVRFASLSRLPQRALEVLLEILAQKNALNDNVLPHSLTPRTRKLGLEGAVGMRRFVLNTIGPSCPNLRFLDVRGCQQVDNQIVRNVLQCCVRLESLRLDGCTRISDSAFAPALWRPPLAGLLELRELTVGKCGQITSEGLTGYVLKGAPHLKMLGLARLAITDDVMSELLFSFGLEVLDVSFCEKITDASFQSGPAPSLRELRLAHLQVTDAAVEYLAERAPLLEVLDVSWVVNITDQAILTVSAKCKHLRTLNLCNTQITDASFEAIVLCKHLERLDVSWCLGATTQALHILACGGPDSEIPRIREFALDHLGALDMSCDQLGSLPPTSPCFFSRTDMSRSSSPLILNWVPPRTSTELPSLALPAPAVALAPETGENATSESSFLPGRHTKSLGDDLSPPRLSQCPWLPTVSPLSSLVTAYSDSLEQLLLDGVRGAVDVAALETIAAKCHALQHLALAIPAGYENEMVLEVQLRSIGSKCSKLTTVRLDASARVSHKAVVAALAFPNFARLTSLTLSCSTKSGGLQDAEFEALLCGRTELKTLQLMNCEGLSDGIFPRWCNRGERHDEALVVEQLDQVLLSTDIFGHGDSIGGVSGRTRTDSVRETVSQSRRQLPRCPAALALRSVTTLYLGGLITLTDVSCYSLAELLHDAQTVDIAGQDLLTEESLRAFRKKCRFLRRVQIVTTNRIHTWTAAATSAIKKHRHRTRTRYSGSSGTESN